MSALLSRRPEVLELLRAVILGVPLRGEKVQQLLTLMVDEGVVEPYFRMTPKGSNLLRKEMDDSHQEIFSWLKSKEAREFFGE
jgi:hypothetical protein